MEISRILPQNPANHAKFAPFVDPLYLIAFRFLTIGRELHEIGVNHTDFAHFANSSSKLCEICRIHTHGQQTQVNPVNSRKIQRMTQILHNPHPHLSNHVKFVTFAHNKAGKLRTFTHMFMHILMAHILHVCTHLALL